MSNIITTNNNQDDDNITSFFQAAKDNSYELVEELIKVVDINSLNEENCPPIYYAIAQKQWKMVQLFIENGAKLNDDKYEWCRDARYTVHNIIHYAVADLNVEESFIDFLLSQPTIKIEQQEARYPHHTPILAAAQGGNLRILKHLISKYQPNIHVKSNYGQNLFYYAIGSKEKCTTELIQYIHSLGVDININDRNCSKSLTYAIDNNLPLNIIQQLIECGAMFCVGKNDTAQPPNLLHIIKRDEIFPQIFPIIKQQFPNAQIITQSLVDAVRQGDIITSKYIVENYRSEIEHYMNETEDLFTQLGLNKSSFFFYKPPFLQSDRFHNILQSFEYLIENGITKGFFNFKMKYTLHGDYTLLLFLAEQPTTTLRLLQLCVQHGADVHAVDCSGNNILHILCNVQKGTTSEDLITKIDYFISLGVNINAIADDELSTPLHFATRNPIHSTKLVSHLINNHHINIGLYFKSKYTNKITVPFHYVHTFETVKIFVSKSNINFRYDDCNTHLSILLGLADNFDKAKYGDDDYQSKCPKIQPIDDDYYKSVIYLLDECGADVNVRNKDGYTPLHIILNSNFERQPIELIKRIIEHQDATCYLNYRSCNCDSYQLSRPLELAINWYCQNPSAVRIKSKALQTIQLLLQHHANPILSTYNNKNQLRQKQTILHYMLKQRKGYDYPYNEDRNADDLESIINYCIDNNHVIPQSNTTTY